MRNIGPRIAAPSSGPTKVIVLALGVFGEVTLGVHRRIGGLRCSIRRY